MLLLGTDEHKVYVVCTGGDRNTSTDRVVVVGGLGSPLLTCKSTTNPKP